MRAVRSEITEYYLELPKSKEAFQLQSLGLEIFQASRNVSSTDPDMPPLTPKDNYREE